MRIQLPLFIKVQVAFGVVMAVLLVVGVIAYRSVLASSESAQWAQHTNEVLEHLANLRLEVESIENGYRDFALSVGCDEMQGYLFGKSVPVESFEREYMSSSASA